MREAGPVEKVLTAPQDDYTRTLLRALPDPNELGAVSEGPRPKVVVEARDIVKSYRRGKDPVLRGVRLTVPAGQTVAIVGESGAGKSTLVRTILKLIDIDSGRIVLKGTDITDTSQRAFRPQRKDVQVVYQNPTAALNPRLTIRQLIEEPLLTFPEVAPTKAERDARIHELIAAVRLRLEFLDRYPTQLSGGQKQRVAIARALATRPSVVVLDEPTASLDLSVRRHVVDLLAELQRSTGVAYILVSHDFATVRSLAHEVAVLYRGEIVESGPAAQVLRSPRNDYTRRLLAAELSTVPGARGAEVMELFAEGSGATPKGGVA